MLLFPRSLFRFLIFTLVFSLVHATAYAATTEAASMPACKKMTLDQLRARYPKAKIIEVTPEEFERLKKQYGNEAVVVKDLPGQMQMDKSLYVQADCVKKPGQQVSRPDGSDIRQPPAVESPPDTQDAPQVNIGMFGHGHVDSDDAVVVFVVIGVFVVAALFVGVGIIAYDMIVNHRKYSPWYDLALAETPVVSHSGTQMQAYDWANLVGVRFSAGLERPNFGVGLTFDAGYLHLGLNDKYDAGRELHQNGSYAMLGPQLRFALGGNIDDHYFFGELLAGRATLDEVDLISAARIGYRGGFSTSSCDRCFWGVNLGSLYLGLKPRDGVLLKDGTRNNTFLLFLGMELGYQF